MDEKIILLLQPRNGAHASDSGAFVSSPFRDLLSGWVAEALVREMKIIRFGQGGKASIKKIIDLWFSEDEDPKEF